MSGKIFNLLLIIVFSFAVGASAQTKKSPVKNNQPYLGCWTGGNTPPTVYRFTATTIKTSITKRNSFRYKEVFRDEEKKIYLLELKETDKQNYLHKFLAIRFIGEESVELKDYETREAFERGEESGRLNVFKEESCRGFSRFFR